MARISEICADKIVEIGIGLETADDYIRNKCINKGFTINAYIEAVCKVKKFENIKVLTYLTVKPLFLTINEGIEDVINSIKIISDYSDIISLEPISIQKNTLIEYLYTKNLYIPPKGWMIKDIMLGLLKERLLNKFELRIGGFEFFPIPELVISNCNLCNKKLYETIDYYNSSKKLNKIKELSCECEIEYSEKKLNEQNEQTIEMRINNMMNSILADIID